MALETQGQENESIAAEPRSFPIKKAQETTFIEERPWERLPDESVQAYARFMAYRNSPSTTRSLKSVAKFCGISDTLVSRWSKRYRWVNRAQAYDAWMVTLSDELDKHAVLSHRRQLVRFGSRSLDKAIAAIDKVDETKLSVNEIGDLAKCGSALARQALGLSDKPQPGVPSVLVQTGVVWQGGPTGQPIERPAWLPASNQPVNEPNKTLPNQQAEVLVHDAEQVIAEPKVCMPVTRLVEKVIACPTVNHNKGKPMGKFD